MRCIRPRKVKVGYTLRPATGTGIAAVPCGVCLNCRINESRVWRNRLLLEQCMHGSSCFVTLTYDDKHIPDPPHISKKDAQDFMKRIRYNVEPHKIRYYCVGEYGDVSFRPHYHLVIYGLDYSLNNAVIKRSWKLCDPEIGISIGELNSASASYITGYITKKTLKEKGEHPINYGKPDEFVLASRRPGIGKPAIDHIVEKLKKDKRIGKQEYRTIRMGGKQMPLGRYLKAHMNNWQNIEFQEKILKFYYQQSLYDNSLRQANLRDYERRVTL